MSDAACGCAASAENGVECDCAMQSECYCDANCECKADVCKNAELHSVDFARNRFLAFKILKPVIKGVFFIVLRAKAPTGYLTMEKVGRVPPRFSSFQVMAWISR